MSPTSAVLILVISIVALPHIDSMTLSPDNCATNSECQGSFCCLLGPSRYTMPTCMPFQQKGEQCRVNADLITANLSYPDNTQLVIKDIHYILCPCAEGLSCDPKHGICN